MAGNTVVFPHDQQAEQALIGACLLNPQVINQCDLSPGDFYLESHGLIFSALQTLRERTDLVTLADALASKGQLERAGGKKYLGDIANDVSTWAGWKYHQEIIRDKARRRQIILSCQQSAHEAGEPSREVPEVLASLKACVTSIEREQTPEIESSLSIVQRVYRDIETRAANGNRFVGIRTGLRNIDEALYGMEPGATTYLIARPSIGKTILALTIADYVAETQGPVLYFTLESNKEALTRRRLSARSKVFYGRIRTGNLEENQWQYVTRACEELSQVPVMVVDHARYKDPERLSSLAETVNMNNKLSLIIIDHIQLMRSRRSFSSRHQEISFASDALQGLAKTCHCPVLILCQLNRDLEKRTGLNKYPQLSDMKESGDLEQNADNVWGLYRKDKETPEARLEQLKGRDSGTWTTWLRVDTKTQRCFDGVEPNEQQPAYVDEEL